MEMGHAKRGLSCCTSSVLGTARPGSVPVDGGAGLPSTCLTVLFSPQQAARAWSRAEPGTAAAPQQHRNPPRSASSRHGNRDSDSSQLQLNHLFLFASSNKALAAQPSLVPALVLWLFSLPWGMGRVRMGRVSPKALPGLPGRGVWLSCR